MPRGLPTANSVPGLTACVTVTPLPLPAIQTEVPSEDIAHIQMVLGKQSTPLHSCQASHFHRCKLVTFQLDQDSRTLSITKHGVIIVCNCMSQACTCLQHDSTSDGHWGSAHIQDTSASHLQGHITGGGVAGEDVPGMLMTFSGPT